MRAADIFSKQERGAAPGRPTDWSAEARAAARTAETEAVAAACHLKVYAGLHNTAAFQQYLG